MKKTTWKGGILPILGALVVLSALSYFLVFAPKIREIRRLQAQVAAKQAEMGDSLLRWGAMARAAGDETRRWEDQVLGWREKVPLTPEVERLMAEIGRKTVQHNLKGFRLIIPTDDKAGKSGVAAGPGAATEGTEPEKNKAFAETRLQLTFFSTYRDMAEFVDGIQATKRLLAIRYLTVREKDGEMETTLELTAFHRKPE